MTLQSESFQELKINKKLLLNGLAFFWGVIILFLALADVYLNFYEWIDSREIRRLVNITKDGGISNWVSSVQLLAISIILWIILFVLLYSKPYIIRRKIEKLGWGVSAMFFTYLAVDDGSKMHERIGSAFRNSFEARNAYNPSFISNLFEAFPSYGWLMVFVPVFGFIAAFMLFFLFNNLKSKRQFILVFLGFSFYAAAVVIDFFEGMEEQGIYDGIILFFDTDLYGFGHFTRLIEEVFEMVGNTFFMVAFTNHLISLSENWNIQLVDSVKGKEN
ncbi:MAG: hypothetical protein HKO01_02160 [Flaviramulus sp.]|nr:hypothetical protein [Flaviramulus sp.]NNC49320.1 hypothetical protein [Flaviramulus sp.]